ncbi:MAG: ATP synthase F0 subunit A [Acidobacteria bacterium ACB1]|nr:ATP synthase subunit a [Pyrinomonadaceae bacterium]MCE7961683.1 ATP synthase F0 subunit A [Acidobacteria bacterium ACB1]RIJ91781.1 MAG: ATP synthase F0 subunit A [Acidobacteriota bacterium]
MFLLAEGGEHTPLIVEFLNHYLGEPVYRFQIAYTKPLWDKFFAHFGTTPEVVFNSPYSPETAIPWYTVMFVIACLLSVFVIYLLKGKLSEDDPKGGQLTLEAGYLAVRDLLESVIGSHGQRYFPVVATFAVLILISNLMGQFPMFMSPTASVNVTYALGLSSFIYYNYVGIKENGVGRHIAHLAGPKLPWFLALITGLIFCIELISNVFRPFTLGVRLFANMFSDEKVFVEITNIYPPYTHFILPLALTGLGVFVAFVQTLVFSLLSMIYIGEVTHEPHDEHEHDAEHAETAAAHA